VSRCKNRARPETAATFEMKAVRCTLLADREIKVEIGSGNSNASRKGSH
jgi:hypothetical protein